MIRNLSIKTKLLIGFMTIVLLIGATGLFGKIGLSITENNAEQIYSNNYKALMKYIQLKKIF